MSVLLLNASYEPLTTVSWQRATTLVLTGRAELVDHDVDRTIRSAGGDEFPWPLVVRLMSMVQFTGMRRTGPPRYSRRALRARDNSVCQVMDCVEQGTTVDHVVPRARGGRTSFTNCVLMCHAHNSKKGDRSLEDLGWTLKHVPRAPTATVVVLDRRPEWEGWLAPA